jgi:hypothetical protein
MVVAETFVRGLAAATTHFAATRPFTEIRRFNFPLTLGRQKCQGKRGNVPVRQAAVYDVIVGRGVKRRSLDPAFAPLLLVEPFDEPARLDLPRDLVRDELFWIGVLRRRNRG